MVFRTKRYYDLSDHLKVSSVADFNKNYTRRFKAFLKSIEAEQGDTFWKFEFSVYIQEKWTEFENLTGREPYRYAKTMEVQDQFDDFLETGQIPLF